MTEFSFLVPGAIDQLTGGYLYARHLVDALRVRGIAVAVRELAGEYPEADACARNDCAAALAALSDGAVAVIDGLALGGFAEAMAREARRLRLVMMVHHPLADETGLAPEAARRFAAIEARLLPLAAGAICPSARTAEALAAYGVAPARIAVAPPGTMKPKRPMPRRCHPEWEMRMLSVATVTPRKGHLVLIEALRRLGPRRWRLDIVGSLTRDPDTVAAVRRALDRDEGLAVTLSGERPQAALAAAYEQADLFVLPSYHEGYGMAFAEAMAWGLPIVATTAGAIPETVPPSACILVAPGDADALAQALVRVIDEPAVYDGLAAGSAAAGARLAGWDEASGRWLDGLRRIVG